MNARFELRRAELLADCAVGPDDFAGLAQRLEAFAEPSLATLPSPESKAHGRTCVAGLLSDVARRSPTGTTSIAKCCSASSATRIGTTNRSWTS